MDNDRMQRNKPSVTHIGGIFVAAKDPKALAEWYKDKLGLAYSEEYLKQYGVYSLTLPFVDPKTSQESYIVWSIFKQEVGHEHGSALMINYRVNDLKMLARQLRDKNVPVKGPEMHPQGFFAWVTDPEGNSIELWEEKKAAS